MSLPYTVFDHPEIALLALILDLLIGDPKLPWPHPVILIGKLINKLEVLARYLLTRLPLDQALLGRLIGCLSVFLALLLVYLVVIMLLSIPYIGYIVAVYLAYAGLAMGCLLTTGKEVLNAIANTPIEAARLSLSQLVSRETKEMDKPLLYKTLADTLTENYTDALTAPFFWLLVTGPLGLWLYKTVSTFDSMWGYRTPKWRYLGCAGAKLDDLLAYVPARISLLAVGLTDFTLKLLCPTKRVWSGAYLGFFSLLKQTKGMPSPNSGLPMAAFASLLRAKLGGPSVYFGELVQKPYLGWLKDDAKVWNYALVAKLLQCLHYASIIGMVYLWASLILLRYF